MTVRFRVLANNTPKQKDRDARARLTNSTLQIQHVRESW